ncbi:hypothetical protein LCGC14_2341600, partial [marine sediment metagenome]
MAITKRDIDAIYVALRPRLKGIASDVVAPTVVTVAPHTHSSEQITHEGSGNIAGDDVQEVIEELDSEKLARDGSQTMLGDLPMNSNAIGGGKNLTNTMYEHLTNTQSAFSYVNVSQKAAGYFYLST